MAGTTVLGRLTWQAATIAAARTETPSAVTLTLDVPSWRTHVAGQHIDVRLTSEDGYTAQRSYSIASVPGTPGQFEITIQRVPGGEVSGYLTDIAEPSDVIEVRGPVGGYFIWPPRNEAGTAPVLLIAGGSGIVPLMSMIRARASADSRVPFRLIYSVRTPADAIYLDELRTRIRDDHGLDVMYQYTREAPDGWRGTTGRLGLATLTASGWPAELEPDVYVCGPTGFVETAANLLVDSRHAAERIRTERFGPTGGAA